MVFHNVLDAFVTYCLYKLNEGCSRENELIFVHMIFAGIDKDNIHRALVGIG